MADFIVNSIIDNNTIQVSPNWTWLGKTGNIVKVNGINLQPGVASAPNPFIIGKLQSLILNKGIELKNPTEVTTINQLKCSVFLNGIDVSYYFPELKAQSGI